jgi:hypothetical protein
MSYFEDLSQYTYVATAGPAINVGWLDAKHDFPTEQPSAPVLDALWRYCLILVVPTRGLHRCDLCSLPSSTFVRHGTRLLLGPGEIRVLGANGDLFAAPNLIYHYVSDHHYRPPHEFLQAVVDEPRPESEEYRNSLDRMGLRWEENVPVSDEPAEFRFVRTETGVERVEVKRRR